MRSCRASPPPAERAHAIVFADDAERARAFFGDVLGLGSVDAGDGWLIFALPPAELACHPGPASSASTSRGIRARWTSSPTTDAGGPSFSLCDLARRRVSSGEPNPMRVDKLVSRPQQ